MSFKPRINVGNDSLRSTVDYVSAISFLDNECM